MTTINDGVRELQRIVTALKSGRAVARSARKGNKAPANLPKQKVAKDEERQ
jgi:hypothetical protein